MKICHIHSHMVHNGVGTSGSALIREQAKRGHDIRLYHRPGAWLETQEFPENVTVGPMEMGKRLLNYAECSRVRKELTDWGCDVIHSHGTGADRIGALSWARWGIPSVAKAAARIPHYHWWFHDAVIGPSKYTRDWYAQKWLVGPKRFRIVHNFVPDHTITRRSPEARAALRGELGLPPEAFIIGVVGTVNGRKNQSAGIPVLAGLRATGVNAHLVLLGGGKGDEWQKVEATIASHNLQDAVHLLGHREDVMPLQAGFDAGMSTSTDEQGSLVTIEALGAALPYVTSPVGMAQEIIFDNQNGLIFDPEDPAPAITYLTRLAQDAGFAAEQSAAARALFEEKFLPDPILDRFEAVYREVIEKRKR